MFGTLRLDPSIAAGPTFVERADGAAFSALGNNVPQHAACDQCRQKKLRCTGSKTGCDRCQASLTDCTYTGLLEGNGRRRDRKRKASQNELSNVSALSSEQHPSDAMETIVVASTSNSSTLSQPGNDSASALVTSVDVNTGSSSDPSAHNDSRPLDPALPDDSNGAPNPSYNTVEEFAFFDLDPSSFDPNGHPNLPDFDLLAYGLPGISSLRATQAETRNFPGSVSNHFTPTSSDMLANRVLGHHIGSGSSCTGGCLAILKSLLEDVEAHMHDMKPCKADAALSYQKKACVQCDQVVRCKSCYIDPDALMFLTMIFDKLIMLSKKILWYTKEGSSIEQPLLAGEYEVDQPDEWGGIVQLLTAAQLRRIKLLVDTIEKSPAIEGKHALRIIIRSVKDQAAALLGRIKQALSKAVDVT